MTKAAVAAGVITEDLTAKYGSQQAAMEKLMEQGKLYSKDVLPFFGREIEKVVGSGLDKALQSNMNAMGRLKNVWESTANLIFKSGFGEGLTDMFNTLASLLKDNEHLFTALGRIAGSVLKGLSLAVEGLSNILQPIGTILKSITDLLGDFSGIAAAAFSPLVYTLLPRMVTNLGLVSKMLVTIRGLAARLLLPFIGIVGALEELVEFWNPSGKKTLIGYNINTWRERNKEIHGKIDRAVSNGMSPYTVGGFERAKPQGYSYTTQPPQQTIHTETTADITLDGEAVGRAVVRSSYMQESMNRKQNEFSYNNY